MRTGSSPLRRRPGTGLSRPGPKRPGRGRREKRRRLKGHPAQPVDRCLVCIGPPLSTDANSGPRRLSRKRRLTTREEPAIVGRFEDDLPAEVPRRRRGGDGRRADGPSRALAGGRPAPQSSSFTLGLASYTFREFDLEATLAMARRLAFERITLKDMHLPLDSPEDRIRRRLKRSGRPGSNSTAAASFT